MSPAVAVSPGSTAQKESLQTCKLASFICKLGSSEPAASDVAPQSPCPMQINCRASTVLWAPDDSSPLTLLPHRSPQFVIQWQETATTHPTETQALGFGIFWCQEAFISTKHGGPALPTIGDSREPSLPHERARTCPSSGSTRILFPQGTQKPSTSHCAFLQKRQISPNYEL
jgi:hypothetical protein